MSRLTIRRVNPRHAEAGRRGGEATAASHDHTYYQQLGARPVRDGSRPRGRPAIPDYVIGNDGLVYSGREAIAIARDSQQEHNPAYSDTD